MVITNRNRDAILSQFDQYKHAPAASRHRGLAYYDAERMKRKLEPDRRMQLLPPTGAVADWLREFCPDLDLSTEPVASGSNWNRETVDGLKTSWHCGRFHLERSRTAVADEPATLPTQLDFDGFCAYTGAGKNGPEFHCRASFTFNDPGVAAKAQAAIERIRAGKLLAKDLPKHIAAPPTGLTTGSDHYSYARQQWYKPDANGQRQYTFKDTGPVVYTESTWNAVTQSWETRRGIGQE
jgi:hypothetical protein